MEKALKYLLQKEWSMGNGQCDECCGCKPNSGWWTNTVGHKKGCKMAAAIKDAGGKPIYEHKNKEPQMSFYNDYFSEMNKEIKKNIDRHNKELFNKMLSYVSIP